MLAQHFLKIQSVVQQLEIIHPAEYDEVFSIQLNSAFHSLRWQYDRIFSNHTAISQDICGPTIKLPGPMLVPIIVKCWLPHCTGSSCFPSVALLPQVEFRITYKLCPLVYKALATGHSSYLSCFVQPYSSSRSTKRSKPELKLLYPFSMLLFIPQNYT